MSSLRLPVGFGLTGSFLLFNRRFLTAKRCSKNQTQRAKDVASMLAKQVDSSNGAFRPKFPPTLA